MKFNDEEAEVVRSMRVEEDELVLITTGGQTVRIRVSEVRETGRPARGVRLIKLREKEQLQAFTKVAAGEEEEAEEAESEEPQADEPK